MSDLKKLLSLLIALALALPLGIALAGEYTITEEPVTIQVVFAENDISDSRTEMWVFQKIAQTTGVQMNIEKISDSIWNERKNLMFAAGELPDLIRGNFSDAEWLSFYGAGQLRPVDDLLKDMPNYTAILDNYTSEEKFRLYDAEGHMKGLLEYVGDGLMAIPGARAIINEQWLKNVGKEMPTNFEELVDVLTAFRDMDANGNGDPDDEYPLSGYTDYKVDAFVAMPLGISVTWSEKADWVEADGGIEYLYTQDVYREYLRRMNLLYSEKLLDNEYYTQNRAQMLAKGANMQIGVCTFNAPFVLTGDVDMDRYGQYTAMIPMGSEYSEPKQFYDRISNPYLYITSATESNGNLEIVSKLYDFFWTEEYATYRYGPEKGSEILGDWNGEGGVVWNEDRTSWNVEVPEKYNGVFEYAQNEVSSLGAYYFDLSDFLKRWDMVEEDRHLIDIFEPVWDYVVPGFPPALSFTAEEQEEIALIGTDLKTYVQQMEAKFVMGEEPLDDAGWQAFQDRLNGMDVDILIRVHKAAYGRYLDQLSKID